MKVRIAQLAAQSIFREMEEANQILLQALEQAGVSMPARAESVQDLSSPAVLVAICSSALALIHGSSTLSVAPSFPSSMSDRIRLCTEIASSINHLGFKGDLSFHQFLYPSEEETHRLLRFLIDKISCLSDNSNGHGLELGPSKFTRSSSNGQTDFKVRELSVLEEQSNILSSENLKLTHEIMELNQCMKNLEVECELSSKRVEGLRKEKDILNMAAEIVLSLNQTEDLIMLQLKNSIEESQKRLVNSRTEWESIFVELENKRTSLESSASIRDGELHYKLQELENVREQIKATTIELQQRDEQIDALAGDLEKIAKGPSRSSYVARITELIKNSKKLDTDISRIIGETRVLQRESNVNQGRLKRTYALVDELVFRDAKKDAAGRQAYRLLTSFHENFAECYDKVFTLDKVHREVAELQATLEAMEKMPLDLKRAEADFEALVSENASLEKPLQVNMRNSSRLL